MKKITITVGLVLSMLISTAVFAESTIQTKMSAISASSSLLHQIMPSQTCLFFTRNLGFGARGEDVRQLQIFLNQDDDTKVSASGTGSVGNESTYFGPATIRALAKFQEKHADDILTPSGMIRGNGFFGRLTRMKIQALCGVVSTKNAPTISSVNPSSGPIGTVVTITGTGFSTTTDSIITNNINIDGMQAATHINTLSSTTLSFTIPEYLSADCGPGQACIMLARLLETGSHQLTVKTVNGVSNAVQFTVTSNGGGTGGTTSTTSPLTVLSPNGGERIILGSTTTISWLTPNVTYIQAPRFNIYLVREEPACARSYPIRCMIAVQAPLTIAENVIGSSGTSTYAWAVATKTEGYQQISEGSYRIQVCNTGNSICDTSDSSFTIGS